MESPTLKMLRQRRSQLEERKAELKAQLGPVEAEMAEVDAAMRAITGHKIAPTGAEGSARSVAHYRRKAHPSIQEMTFKQMVVKALSEYFKNGATANELLDFFKEEWGREIMRTSLSPQLSRLKNDNIIRLEGKIWHLSVPAKAFGVPGLFPDENGEAEASPDADEVAASSEQ